MNTGDSMPNLLCGEDESSFNASGCDQDKCLELCSVSELDCEFIEASLTHREADYRLRVGEKGISAMSDGGWLNRARLDAIKWIIQTSALFGYQRQTAYLSVIFFDRFLMKRKFDDGKLWQVELLAIACLSLAAKMEELGARELTEYRVDEHLFEPNTIQRMELLVLNALEWRMLCITPFTYLDYFALKLCGESTPKDLVYQASELVLSIMEEINVAEHKPSTVAAAAVLASYDGRLTKIALENKVEAIPSWGSLEKDDVLCCYTIYQEIMTSKTPKSVITQVSSSPASTDDSQITSKENIKKRLNFDANGRHRLVKRINRP